MEYEGTYRITLDLTINRNEYEHPEDWPWPMMLDMPPEHVRLVEVTAPTEWRSYPGMPGNDEPDERHNYTA